MAPASASRCALALTASLVAASLAPASASAAGFAYAANQGADTISQYSIGSDGALTSLGATDAVADSRPWDIVVSPDGKSAYASYSGAVAQFDIGEDGRLTPKPEHETIPAVGSTSNLAISPDGKSLYVTNFGDNSISQYDIGDGGVLSAKSEATTPALDGPAAIVFTPDGSAAYVANFNDGSVTPYQPTDAGGIGWNPDLSEDCGMSGQPNDLRVSPDGQTLYVAAVAGGICVFDISGFTLEFRMPGNLTPAGNPWGVEVTPLGDSVYSPLSSGSAVAQFNVFEDGSLGFKSPSNVAAGMNPQYAAASPDGKSLYSTNAGDATVSQFDIGDDGKLAAKTTATVAAGTNVKGIAVTPNQAPTAAFAATSGQPGAPTSFDATSSSDPNGQVARYDWDFGDGTTLPDGGPTPSHTYREAGTYSVSLVLTDDLGCSETIYTGKTAVCNATANTVEKDVIVPVAIPAGGGQPTGGQPTGEQPNVAPAIVSASLSRRVFAVNRKGMAEAPVVSRAKKGTSFRYTLSEPARLVIAIDRALPGRRAGRRCVRQTARNRRNRRCTRYVRFGAFGVDSLAGPNTHAFSGRIGRRALRPGRYRATLVATDGGGLSSVARTLGFRVVRR